MTFATQRGKWWERKISERRNDAVGAGFTGLKSESVGEGGWVEKKMDGGMMERRRSERRLDERRMGNDD